LQDLVSSPEGRREVALTLTFNPDFSFLFASNLHARLTQITLDARFRPLFGWVLARSGSMPLASPATGSSQPLLFECQLQDTALNCKVPSVTAFTKCNCGVIVVHRGEGGDAPSARGEEIDCNITSKTKKLKKNINIYRGNLGWIFCGFGVDFCGFLWISVDLEWISVDLEWISVDLGPCELRDWTREI
jgi:hypothetical protein